MRATTLAGALLFSVLAACGDSSGSGSDDDGGSSGSGTPGGDVTGTWTATQGEQGYMTLSQSGGSVTGESCESAGKDCYPIENGSLAGSTLTFSYSFDTSVVDATLTLSQDGNQLAGFLHSSKCDCDLPHTYERQ